LRGLFHRVLALRVEPAQQRTDINVHALHPS
jgi:hypothetical protein